MINFVSLTNSGYNLFADSQIENFKKDFLKNHILYLYCVDLESYTYHSNKDLPDNIIILKMPEVEITGQHSYLMGRFKEMMRLKFPLIIENISKLNTAVWFIDNDVLFFNDPESYIDYSKDIIFQADCHPEFSHSWVCTGCFWINNTENAIRLLKSVIELQSKYDRGEQELLNDYCESWPEGYVHVTPDKWGSILKFKQANLEIFPYYLFQSGHTAFKLDQYDKYDCVMIHFNHESEYNKKVENFIKTKKHYNIN